MPGVLTISLDTELIWGMFEREESKRYIDAYQSTPGIVSDLCDLFHTYDISATWAVVAHLFDNCISDHQSLKERHNRDNSFPCETGLDRDLWYVPSLLEPIASCPAEQELGLHGYSHMVLTDYSREAIKSELTAAVGTAEEYGFSPSTFIFPRNRIAHLDLLAECGFEIYRGIDNRWYEKYPISETVKKPLRFVDEAVAPPPTVTPNERSGLICVPGSHPFRPINKGWKWIPSDRRIARLKQGLKRAVATDRIYHLWFHPFNLAASQSEQFDILEEVFQFVDELRANDGLEVIPMQGVATAFREGRW